MMRRDTVTAGMPGIDQLAGFSSRWSCVPVGSSAWRTETSCLVLLSRISLMMVVLCTARNSWLLRRSSVCDRVRPGPLRPFGLPPLSA